jgi:hypothetical protein
MSYLTLVMLALEILNPSDAGLGATFMVGATCLACAAHVALSPNLPYVLLSRRDIITGYLILNHNAEASYLWTVYLWGQRLRE